MDLYKRIVAMGSTPPMAGAHPAAPPGTPMVMAMNEHAYRPVQSYVAGSGYGTLTYQDLWPVFDPTSGGNIPAKTPEYWGNVRPAGRP